MFCAACGTQLPEGNAQFCTNCGASCTPGVTLPAGIAGWSWGAFLLNWIWAIGNRTWIGLLALVPYLGIGIAIWLGIKGREMAWKNGRWDSVEHFNRVQRKWSLWGVSITISVAVISFLASIMLIAYLAIAPESKIEQFSPELAAAIAENSNDPETMQEENSPAKSDK